MPHLRTRLATLATAGAALATLTACAAPPQPDPAAGHAATLATDVFAFDHPEFRTNRKDLLEPNDECRKISDAVISKIGVPPPKYASESLRTQEDPSKSFTTPGCQLGMSSDDAYEVSASAQPFSAYWAAQVQGDHQPGTMKSGILSFKRAIIKDHYYAVTYLAGYRSKGADAGDCVTTVDTGSPNPLVVSRKAMMNDGPQGDSGNEIPLPDIVRQQCVLTRQAAEIILDDLDKNGGSRVS